MPTGKFQIQLMMYTFKFHPKYEFTDESLDILREFVSKGDLWSIAILRSSPSLVISS